jgi:hypothetical protein
MRWTAVGRAGDCKLVVLGRGGLDMQWEYSTKTLDVSGWFTDGEVDPSKVDRILNPLGAGGWELVSSFSTTYGKGGSNKLVFIFKRPNGTG